MFQNANSIITDSGQSIQVVLNSLPLDTSVVHKTGNETIAGVKTFSSSPIVPTPTTDMQVATKLYVDGKVGAIDRNFIYGFIPSSNVTTPDEDIDITAGISICKDLSTFVELSADATALSMPTLLGSALGNSTTYHLFRYKKNDDTDQWHLSTSLTPTIADIKSANAYRRVFPFKTDSSGDIVKFKGDELPGGALRIAYDNTDGGGNIPSIANYDIGYTSQAYFDYTNINLNNPSIRVKLEITCYTLSGSSGAVGLVFKDNVTGECKSTTHTSESNTGCVNIHCDSNGQVQLKLIATKVAGNIVQIKCVAYVDYRINN